MTIYMRVYFWTLDSVPLMYALSCARTSLDDCSFAVRFLNSFRSFSGLFVLPEAFYFHKAGLVCQLPQTLFLAGGVRTFLRALSLMPTLSPISGSAGPQLR